MQARTYVLKSDACVRRHGLTHAAKVLEIMKDKFFCINVKVWNESYIVWESFQTPIFSLYKAIHGTFSKHIGNPKRKIKIH